jgi:hypothetical protein
MRPHSHLVICKGQTLTATDILLENIVSFHYNEKCVSRSNPHCVVGTLPSLPGGALTPPGGTTGILSSQSYGITEIIKVQAFL